MRGKEQKQSEGVSRSAFGGAEMHEIIYLVGLVVVVMFVLSVLGLR